MTTQIDPGKGYRLLNVGEVIRRGDEYRAIGDWHRYVASVGRVMTYPFPARRKLKGSIYIAGKMRGIKDFNFPAFFDAEEKLRKLDYDIFNPARRDEDVYGKGFATSETGDLKDIPAFDLREALQCDLQWIAKNATGIALLPGWEDSKGAQAEAALGRALGIEVKPLEEFLTGAEVKPADVSPRPLEAPSEADPMVTRDRILDGIRSHRQSSTAQLTGEVRVTDPTTGGQKGSKPERFDLIPVYPLSELARVYGFGATKYDPWNWTKGYKWSLSYAALQRHLNQFWSGEDIDSESNHHHLAHAAWHCMTMLHFWKFNAGTDDRLKVVTGGTQEMENAA